MKNAIVAEYQDDTTFAKAFIEVRGSPFSFHYVDNPDITRLSEELMAAILEANAEYLGGGPLIFAKIDEWTMVAIPE